MDNNIMKFLMNMMSSGGTPEQIALQLFQQQNNPMSQNLMKMAKEGNGAGIEQIARNLCQQRGLDFDTEFKAFKQKLGLK